MPNEEDNIETNGSIISSTSSTRKLKSVFLNQQSSALPSTSTSSLPLSAVDTGTTGGTSNKLRKTTTSTGKSLSSSSLLLSTTADEVSVSESVGSISISSLASASVSAVQQQQQRRVRKVTTNNDTTNIVLEEEQQQQHSNSGVASLQDSEDSKSLRLETIASSEEDGSIRVVKPTRRRRGSNEESHRQQSFKDETTPIRKHRSRSRSSSSSPTSRRNRSQSSERSRTSECSSTSNNNNNNKHTRKGTRRTSRLSNNNNISTTAEQIKQLTFFDDNSNSATSMADSFNKSMSLAESVVRQKYTRQQQQEQKQQHQKQQQQDSQNEFTNSFNGFTDTTFQNNQQGNTSADFAEFMSQQQKQQQLSTNTIQLEPTRSTTGTTTTINEFANFDFNNFSNPGTINSNIFASATDFNNNNDKDVAFSDFNAFDAFDNTDTNSTNNSKTTNVSKGSVISLKHKKFDSKPHTTVPKMDTGKLIVSQHKILSKDFSCPPITNPLNGNIIYCTKNSNCGGYSIHEIDIKRINVQVGETNICTQEMYHIFLTKYTYTIQYISRIITIQSGLYIDRKHRRVQVAALVELEVIELNRPVQAVLVWQWGYGVPFTTLQYVIQLPNDASYDTDLLRISDNILFLAGTSSKGSLIFVYQLAMSSSSDVWNINLLETSSKVTNIIMSDRIKRQQYPYVAISFGDGTISVWTYESCFASTSSTNSSAKKLLLQPLCKLDVSRTMSQQKWTKTEENEKLSENGPSTFKECTDLAWIGSGSQCSSLMLLAASFQNGVAIFHVVLPVSDNVQPSPESFQTSTLSSTPNLSPISVMNWQKSYHRTSVCWHSIGSHSSPMINIALRQKSVSEISYLVGALVFDSSEILLDETRALLPLVLVARGRGLQQGHFCFMRQSNDKGTIGYGEQGLYTVDVSATKSGELQDSFESLRFPVLTGLSGLTSTGDLLNDSVRNDSENVFFLFRSIVFKNSNLVNGANADVCRPCSREYIAKAVCSGKVEIKTRESSEALGFGEIEKAVSEATAQLVCELVHKDLNGMRASLIVRSSRSDLFSVVYRQSLHVLGCDSHANPLNRKVAFINSRQKPYVLDVVDGRDVAFFSRDDSVAQGLLLDSSSLVHFSWDGTQTIQCLNTYRPILGVNCDEQYIDCSRIFVLEGALTIRLLAIGRMLRDNVAIIVAGESSKSTVIESGNITSLLPNIETGFSFLFDDGELVFSVVGLESEGPGDANIAIGTSERVLIVSSEMKILAKKKVKISSDQLIPLGEFAVCYEAHGKVHYLCCLEGSFSSGTITSLPDCKSAYTTYHFSGLRQDRIHLSCYQSSTCVVRGDKSSDSTRLQSFTTKPILLLEALVANAACILRADHSMMSILRTVIERFGRKVSLITHSEQEGLGQKGAGITGRVLRLLNFYGLHDAASWLLSGSTQFDTTSSAVLLPPWLPVSAKSFGTTDAGGICQLLSNGDSNLNEYIKSCDRPANLPRPTDPTSYLANEFGQISINKGIVYDSLKMLDIECEDASDTKLAQLTMMLGRSKSIQSQCAEVFKVISGFERNVPPPRGLNLKTSTSLAALSVAKRTKLDADALVWAMKWIEPLAPSIQSAPKSKRNRQILVKDDLLREVSTKNTTPKDRFWSSPCNESKHFWNEGPQKNKSQLLVLDCVEDWLVRRRPGILGKEGALATHDRGEKFLADILNKQDDSFAEGSDIDSVKDCWVQGIGEGRSDEANLSGYYRFSEGEDEALVWRSEGFADLSPYHNKLVIVGDAEKCGLQPSTSSVDEGENGKVKSLFDIVFEASGIGKSSGLAVAAHRGGSLDIGLLHSPERDSRAKFTVELWFYLPPFDNAAEEFVLLRRTMGENVDDLSKTCFATGLKSVLWEVVINKSGEIVFKSCSGAVLAPHQSGETMDSFSEDVSSNNKSNFVVFDKWNHFSLVLSSKGLSDATCDIKMYLKGVEVASDIVSMMPPGFNSNLVDKDSRLDDLLKSSHILIGLNHPIGLRLTELRFWACCRSADDIQSFLYEYLNAAEQKKKFKVKITNKSKNGPNGIRFGLTPPKQSSNGKSDDKISMERGSIQMKSANAFSGLLSPEKQLGFRSSYLPAVSNEEEEPILTNGMQSSTATAIANETLVPSTQPKHEQEDQNDVNPDRQQTAGTASFNSIPADDGQEGQDTIDTNGENNDHVTLWDIAVALSTQIKPSAAAALIRGPPATRHYGGNRGGLPDFSGADRFGVGGIAICGSEKTIVFRDNEDPPALTYPIGASGALISDQMDDEGSEFLCCFLANEKRMVVFELRSRTVVVELQMTTKLNFWRYLPPEAAENTLCFMLITPVGGFHWLPLEESPRPRQVWKREGDLLGKKIVGYEEGGTNGLEDQEIRSRVGLILCTKASGGGFLEAWIVSMGGNSALSVSNNLAGACLCQPHNVEDGAFLPIVVTASNDNISAKVDLIEIVETDDESLLLGNVLASHEIDITEYQVDFEPPPLAMGTFPEALCVSLQNIIVIILRRKGVIAAFEFETDGLHLIAQECLDHYVVDAVMRYSSQVGGAEIVMLLADDENPKDGRTVSFCFRSSV